MVQMIPDSVLIPFFQPGSFIFAKAKPVGRLTLDSCEEGGFSVVQVHQQGRGAEAEGRKATAESGRKQEFAGQRPMSLRSPPWVVCVTMGVSPERARVEQTAGVCFA